MAPPFLTSGDGALIGWSLDVVKDAYAERTRQGLLVRFPQQDASGTPGPHDAQSAMGRDRRVVRGINESAAAYSVRMLAWIDDRKRAGNAFALLQKLSEYLGAGCVLKTVDAQGNWYVRAADGTETYYLRKANWEWDSHPLVGGIRRWSRFWVIIHPPASLWTEGATYGSGYVWGDTTQTYGSTATPAQVQTVRFIISDWMPAGTRCANVIEAFDPASFDPTGAVDDAGMPNFLWEHWSKNVGGVQVPARLSTARYWDGVSS
jgi:hypothetical protein